MMDRIFFILYTVVISTVYIILLPFLYFFSKQKVKYQRSIPARFFLDKNSPFKPDGIWFHVCSFGEARAIFPILEQLPENKLRLSTTTQTGFDAIASKSLQSRYLPFEPLLFKWQTPQKALVVMEAEFWYLLFSLAKKRGAKTLLINARISDRSFPKYQRIAWLYKQIFKYVDEVYAQSEIDKERLEVLGANDVKVIGNIKLANIAKVTKELTKPKALLICGASTHETEEELILEAFVNLKEENPTARLILVPRHPERFDEVSFLVESYADKYHYTWHNYSKNEAINSDIIVVDVLGELVNIYAISDVVILGGAFSKMGGHNAAEAAQFGCKIISGEHYFNQRDIFSMIEGISIVTQETLARRLQQHGQLISTRIIQRTDIQPILDSLNCL